MTHQRGKEDEPITGAQTTDLHMGKKEIEPYPSPHVNMHVRHINDLNVKRKTYRNKYRLSPLISKSFIKKFMNACYVMTSTVLLPVIQRHP